MKIRSDSWHYRLWRFGRESPYSKPVDLCRYFWHILLVKIMLPLALVAVVLLLFGLLIYVIATNLVISTMVALGIGALIVLVIFGVVLDRRANAKEALYGPKPKKVKEPSLVREFLKARKQKICPLIEVIDE